MNIEKFLTVLVEISEYFEKFGRIFESTVVFDSSSKRPGGFGFVSLEYKPELQKVLEMDHWIRGVKIDCKLALDKNEAKMKDLDERKRKIFVGGLPRNLPDKQLKEYFKKFGNVEKAYVVKDFKTGKTRGRSLSARL